MLIIYFVFVYFLFIENMVLFIEFLNKFIFFNLVINISNYFLVFILRILVINYLIMFIIGRKYKCKFESNFIYLYVCFVYNFSVIEYNCF